MPTLRVLICDDEPGMRLILRKIVERTAGFEVVAEAADGREAVELFARHRPDVAFLDVDMPALSGVDCARIMADIDPGACLIFATAHEQYMKDAFAVYAFDYLIKPFPIERVEETLARVYSRRAARETVPVRENARKSSGLSKLMIRHKEGVSLVDMGDIIMIQREDRSTVLYTAQERIVTGEPLSDIMDRLDPQLFFRSHKSYIINLAMVSRIYPYGRWTYVVKLKNTTQDALITYEKFGEMEQFFSGISKADE